MEIPEQIDRRSILKGTGVGLAAGLAGCSGDGGGGDGGDGGGGDDGGGDGGQETASIHTLETEGSIMVATFLYAQGNNVWDQYNIDLSFEVAPFAKYNRQVASGNAEIGGPATTATVSLINDGEGDLVFVGNQLNMFNRIFTKSGRDDIEDPTDLAGQRVGLPVSETSTTSYTHRALVQDEYDVNLLEDTAETTTAAPPALWELLMEDELDAISQFSGFTIRGMASDEVKTVFDPHELWMGRHGTGLPTTLYSARRDWFESNRGVTNRFLNGWDDAAELFGNESEDALQNYGQLAGVTDEDQAAVVTELAENGVLYGPAHMSQDHIDSAWEFLNLLTNVGAFDELPEKDALFVSESELTEA